MRGGTPAHVFGTRGGGGSRGEVASLRTVTTELVQVTGIRCERCVMRLAKVLEGAEGLESANASLMGQVQLVYYSERTSRAALLALMAGGGFREQAFV